MSARWSTRATPGHPASPARRPKGHTEPLSGTSTRPTRAQIALWTLYALILAAALLYALATPAPQPVPLAPASPPPAPVPTIYVWQDGVPATITVRWTR
jgi:hypothetical protein